MDKDTFYSLIPQARLRDAIGAAETPCYLYFTSILRNQVERIRACTAGAFELHYAVKANPNLEILRELAHLGVGADVASAGELRAAISAGIPPESIEFSGPGKSEKELELAIETGIQSINIENLQEIAAIEGICNRRGFKARAGVRINPGKISGRVGMRMAGDTQFGLEYPEALKAMKMLEQASHCIEFTGLHAHFASQELDATRIAANIRTLIRCANDLASESQLAIRKLNFGGGWGIRYFPNQIALDLDLLATEIASVLQSPGSAVLQEKPQLVLEPGRFIVGECGVFVTRVLYRKKSGAKEYLIVDGGMNANYILAGGMGQVIKRNFEMDVLTAGSQRMKSTTTFEVAGPLCTPQDVLASGFETGSDVQPGDAVVFFNCGAYGPSASPIHFLSHRVPGEILVRE